MIGSGNNKDCEEWFFDRKSYQLRRAFASFGQTRDLWLVFVLTSFLGRKSSSIFCLIDINDIVQFGTTYLYCHVMSCRLNPNSG